MKWKIWGDAKDPLFEADSKEEVIAEYKRKLYHLRDDTYIEDPDGNEYVWNDITEKIEEA